MIVLAIDPGYEQSGWVLYDGRVQAHGIDVNADLLHRLRAQTAEFSARIDTVVIESIESYGMSVGRETFETVHYAGRLYEVAWQTGRAACLPEPIVERMTRRTVKLHLCSSARAQDANIRTALCDRFGGKLAAIGKTKTPGPLFGIKSHEWSALALAVVWHDQQASPLGARAAR
jgi:hypothetical protein